MQFLGRKRDRLARHHLQLQDDLLRKKRGFVSRRQLRILIDFIHSQRIVNSGTLAFLRTADQVFRAVEVLEIVKIAIQKKSLVRIADLTIFDERSRAEYEIFFVRNQQFRREEKEI